MLTMSEEPVETTVEIEEVDAESTDEAHEEGAITLKDVTPKVNKPLPIPAGVPSDERSKRYKKNGKLRKNFYEAELFRLQEEFVKLQRWVADEGLRVLIVFEGRGSAGKGGVIKRIAERTNPRIMRTVALPKPSDRERTQWYFQRYVAHLPAAGEIVMFDRSWYNRSNVEWVMGFTPQDEVEEFLRSCPQFERMLVRSGMVLLKYWFSVSYEEQRRRFMSRNMEPLKRWKLSDIDVAEHRLFDRFSQAKDMTFEYTDIKQAPWYVVPADDKKKARLNCMAHILGQIEYENTIRPPVDLPEREKIPYIRPPMDEQTFVPQTY
jgi:polyphosphate kinase 2